MQVVISPAKRLDWDPVEGLAQTQPDYQADAVALSKVAGRLSQANLQSLMSISADLAKLNQARFKAFAETPDPTHTRPAARAFAGDTYTGLQAETLDDAGMDWAQDHLRILSGLYGMLRPLDAIQPYRLEMGSRLKTRKGSNLYAYWGARLAEELNARGAALNSDVLVNCASQEYFGAVDQSVLKLRVITPVFLEDKPGGPKIVSFFAKKARGAMARYIIDHRLTDPADLRGFDTDGYQFQAEQSDEDRLVFLRSQEGALSAA